MTIEKNTNQSLVNNRFFKGMPEDVLRSSAPTMRAILVLPDKNKEEQAKESDVLSYSPSM